MITKTYNWNIKVKSDSREITAIASTDAIDWDNEIVLPSGLVKENYTGTPILWAHNHSEPAIGKVLWIKPDSEDASRVVCKYMLHCKTQLSTDVYTLLSNEILKGHSIGFDNLEDGPPTPEEIKQHPEWKDARNIVRKWRLVELSVCNVPCNPEALALAVQKGISGLLQNDECIEWETTKEIKQEKAQIALPKYSRKMSMQQEIERRVMKQLNTDRIIKRLLGRV